MSTAAGLFGFVFAFVFGIYLLVNGEYGGGVAMLIGSPFIGAWMAAKEASKRRPAVATATATGRPRRQAIPERVRHEVWRRDGGACVDCGSRARLELDHIVPVSKGGANTVRNIELRCEHCNRRKGARI